jgi:putative protein-disulfide isomerase
MKPTQPQAQPQQPILWYFADPMCSWCWGFSPVISRIKETFADKIKISLNLGGLRPGTTEPITPTLREEILHHWHQVQRLTGQPFLFDNAMPEGFVYDTEPASRAVLSFAKLQPERTLAYFSAIQSAFYTQGQDVTQQKTLTTLASKFSVEAEAFEELFISDEMRILTREHFKRSYQAGVRGFPTLIWQQGNDIKTLSRGYVSWEDVAELLHQHLS